LTPKSNHTRAPLGAIDRTRIRTERSLQYAAFVDFDAGHNQLPPVNFVQAVGKTNAAAGSGHYAILPFLEQGTVFGAYTQDIPNSGFTGAQFVTLNVFVCPSDPTTSAGLAAGGSLSGRLATCNYSYNLALFGAGNAFNTIGKSSPYTIGTITDGSSNTIGFVEQSAYNPGQNGNSDPTAGTKEFYTSWPYPAYLNTFGPHYPNPDELPGQINYTALYPLPQFGVTPIKADPNTCQSYHPSLMNVGRMDGGVRAIKPLISQQIRTLFISPNDGGIIGADVS
jgi:Protein of unknown function (DUF1559)